MTTLVSRVKKQVKNNEKLEHYFRAVFDTLPVTTRLKITEMTDDPYSELEILNKFIFIHIPKTAGNSIILALYGQPATGHAPLKRYISANPEMYENFFKFAFVRNPWDRLVSAYHYLLQGGKGVYDEEFGRKYISTTKGFSSFIDRLQDDSYRQAIMKWPHFRPQTSYLMNKKGIIDIDFLGRFETIEEDYKCLCDKLNKQNELRKSNSSRHDDFRSYYKSHKMVSVVEETYKQDCLNFNYSFQ